MGYVSDMVNSIMDRPADSLGAQNASDIESHAQALDNSFTSGASAASAAAQRPASAPSSSSSSSSNPMGMISGMMGGGGGDSGAAMGGIMDAMSDNNSKQNINPGLQELDHILTNVYMRLKNKGSR